MKKTITILISAVILVVGGTIILGGSPDPEETNSSKQQSIPDERFDTVPDIILKDYGGKDVALAGLLGKVAVVNSWATWCPFCVDELPAFAQLQKEYPDQLVVVSINRQESLSRSRSYTDDLGVTGSITFLLDPRDRFYKGIGGFSMPETLIADKEGRVILHKRGPMTFEEMKEIVKPLIEKVD